MLLQKFLFEGHEVNYLAENNSPFFVSLDVAEILDLKNHRDKLMSLDDDEKKSIKIDYRGQSRDVNFINESGLYNFIFSSKKPEAKRFKKHVTSVILPSIRKTGQYASPEIQEIDEHLKKLVDEADKLKEDKSFHASELKSKSNELDRVNSAIHTLLKERQSPHKQQKIQFPEFAN